MSIKLLEVVGKVKSKHVFINIFGTKNKYGAN